MNRRTEIALIGVLCVMVAPVFAADRVTATVLEWQEQEPGIEPYATRMFVTEKYLRSDEGEEGEGFLLFERKTQRLYSVSHQDRSVLLIEGAAVPASAGARPVVEVETEVDKVAPTIDGKAVSHLRLTSGGELCMQAAVVPGLLPDVTDAMRSMRALLAGRQYRDLEKTPKEFQTPCFLANYVFEADRALQSGLPIQESIAAGVGRILLDYRSGEDVPGELFELPAEYRLQPVP